MPPQKNPKVDYLRVYPGLNDFSDALEAIPQTVVGYLTHIKQVHARAGRVQSEMRDDIKGYFKARNAETLSKISKTSDVLLPAMDEKMRTAAAAAERVEKQIDRLNADYTMICEHEIPASVQYDLNDPAFYEIVPQDKTVNARSQARREAREARETRRAAAQQAAESRSTTPVSVPEPPAATSGRRRGRTPATRPDIPQAVTPASNSQNDMRANAGAHADSNNTGNTPEPIQPVVQPKAENEKPRRVANNPSSESQESNGRHINGHTNGHSGNEAKAEHVVPPVVMPLATAVAAAHSADQQGEDGEILIGMKRKRGSAPKSSEPVYCYCEQGSFGEMVGCDGPQCEREWFHLGCIGLSALPKGQWFCEECRAKLRRR